MQQLQFEVSDISGFGSSGACTLGWDKTGCPAGQVCRHLILG